MKNKKLLVGIALAVVLLLVTGGILLFALSPKDQALQIMIEGDLTEGAVIEYTGQNVQFPVAHVADSNGNIISYNVEYKVIDLSDNSEMTDEYATFQLKTGKYQMVYTYVNDKAVTKTVGFTIEDTTSPVIEFLEIPNGLFLQDITEDTVNKLPLYSIEDASTGEGIDLVRTLEFKGEGDADFREYTFREINNS